MKSLSDGADLGGKSLVMTATYFLLIGPVRERIGEPYAAGVLSLAIGLIFYWLPPMVNISYRKWAIRCLQVSTAIFMGMTVYTVVFRK